MWFSMESNDGADKRGIGCSRWGLRIAFGGKRGGENFLRFAVGYSGPLVSSYSNFEDSVAACSVDNKDWTSFSRRGAPDMIKTLSRIATTSDSHGASGESLGSAAFFVS